MISQQRISKNQKKSGWTNGRDILDLLPSILPSPINNTISKTWTLFKRKHKRGTLWDGDGVCKLLGASQSVIMIHRLHSAGRSACIQKIKHTFLLSCICIYRNLYFELYVFALGKEGVCRRVFRGQRMFGWPSYGAGWSIHHQQGGKILPTSWTCFSCAFPSFVFVLKCILYSLYDILAGFSYIIRHTLVTF